MLNGVTPYTSVDYMRFDAGTGVADPSLVQSMSHKSRDSKHACEKVLEQPYKRWLAADDEQIKRMTQFNTTYRKHEIHAAPLLDRLTPDADCEDSRWAHKHETTEQDAIQQVRAMANRADAACQELFEAWQEVKEAGDRYVRDRMLRVNAAEIRRREHAMLSEIKRWVPGEPFEESKTEAYKQAAEQKKAEFQEPRPQTYNLWAARSFPYPGPVATPFDYFPGHPM